MYVDYFFGKDTTKTDSVQKQIKLEATVICGIPQITPMAWNSDKETHVNYGAETTIKIGNEGNIPLYYEILNWPEFPFSLDTLDTDIITILPDGSSDRILTFSPPDIKQYGYLVRSGNHNI